MNRITEGNTKNFLALTIVATIAAIFMIPVGLASANHEEGLSGIITKTNDCPDPMTVNTFTQCTITLIYTGDDAVVKDTVPAGWDVTGVNTLLGSPCTDEASNKPKPGKSNNGVGSTKVICVVDDTDTITIEIDTRTTKNGKHQKPTSCGVDVFEVNGGASALADINQDGVPDLFPEHDELGIPTGNLVTLELATADPQFVDVEGCVEED